MYVELAIYVVVYYATIFVIVQPDDGFHSETYATALDLMISEESFSNFWSTISWKYSLYVNDYEHGAATKKLYFIFCFGPYT